MRNIRFLTRILALFLALSLTLPAYALRPQAAGQEENGPVANEIKRALEHPYKRSQVSTGIEERIETILNEIEVWHKGLKDQPSLPEISRIRLLLEEIPSEARGDVENLPGIMERKNQLREFLGQPPAFVNGTILINLQLFERELRKASQIFKTEFPVEIQDESIPEWTIEHLRLEFEDFLYVVESGSVLDAVRPELLMQLKAEIEPLQYSADAFARYIKLREKHPSEFLLEARQKVSALTGFPEDRMVFVSPDDFLVWGLAGVLDDKTAKPTVHGLAWFVKGASDQTGQKVLLIRSDLSDLRGLQALVHEAMHGLQSDDGDISYGEPFFRVVIEGFQRVLEIETIFQLGKGKSKFAKQLKRLVEGRSDPEVSSLLDVIFGGRAGRGKFSFRRKLEGAIYSPRGGLASYDIETFFVKDLIAQIGESNVRSFFFSKRIADLKDVARMGAARLDALRAFFRRVNDPSVVVEPWSSYMIRMAFPLASETILKADVYPEDRTRLLMLFLGAFEKAVIHLPADQRKALPPGERKLSHRIIGLAKSVVEGKVSEPDLVGKFSGLLLRSYQAGAEEGVGLAERMPEWLRSVMTPEEFLESVYRVHDPAIMTERVAVLVQPELLAKPGENLSDAAVRLMSLEGNLRSVFEWPDQVKLRIDPWSEQTEQHYRQQGYRVVRMVRDDKDQMRDPIPQELMLLALSQAVASGQERFAVNVTHDYLKLRGLKLKEIRDQLTNLYA